MGRIKVYVAHQMTGRMCDELVKECLLVGQALKNYGFEPLDPIVGEEIPNTHEPLTQVSLENLNKHWQRDKQMLQEAHIMLDYQSCNKSDGVSVELGLTRFNYWKPVVRIFPNLGFYISRLEFDTVTGTLPDALSIMSNRWGTKRKLLMWRLKMLFRCLPKFVYLQIKFLKDVI